MIYVLRIYDDWDDEVIDEYLYDNQDDLLKAKEIVNQCHKDFTDGVIDYSLYEHINGMLEENNLRGLVFDIIRMDV